MVSLPIGRRSVLGGIAALASTRAVATMAAPALPSGLDARGHFRAAPLPPGAFAYTRLNHGVQFRANGIWKNLIFYAPDTVRVNATLGENYWTAASLVVVAPPQAVPFAISSPMFTSM